MQAKKKVILIIMDGWGHGKNAAASAIAQANTPNVDSYYSRFLNSELRTDGEFVGLPEGQMGNSEVGHLNIGAGRIVYQELQRIFVAIDSGELAENNVLKNAPHTEQVVISDAWDKPYSREKAAYPLEWVRDHKFFATVSRVDEAFGDRNLICTCAPIEAYM